MKKILLLLLTFVLCMNMFACSCAVEETETEAETVSREPLNVPFEGTVKNITVTIITVDSENFPTRHGNPISGDITDVDGMAPTVLDAAKQIFDANNIAYEMGDGMFTSIKGKAENEKDGYVYKWEFKLNSDGGVFDYADSTLVKENDYIIFYLNPHKK